jgi:arylsulfatase A-like enzyme
MLADDLGYGDLSVFPFVGGKVHSPALEDMARNGAIMTNFHAAAPICSPSRASIMTGLFSWRVGIAGVYEYGKRDGRSNRNDWYELRIS